MTAPPASPRFVILAGILLLLMFLGQIVPSTAVLLPHQHWRNVTCVVPWTVTEFALERHDASNAIGSHGTVCRRRKLSKQPVVMVPLRPCLLSRADGGRNRTLLAAGQARLLEDLFDARLRLAPLWLRPTRRGVRTCWCWFLTLPGPYHCSGPDGAPPQLCLPPAFLAPFALRVCHLSVGGHGVRPAFLNDSAGLCRALAGKDDEDDGRAAAAALTDQVEAPLRRLLALVSLLSLHAEEAAGGAPLGWLLMGIWWLF